MLQESFQNVTFCSPEASAGKSQSDPTRLSLPCFLGPSETIFTSPLSQGLMEQLLQRLPNLNNPSPSRGLFIFS